LTDRVSSPIQLDRLSNLGKHSRARWYWLALELGCDFPRNIMLRISQLPGVLQYSSRNIANFVETEVPRSLPLITHRKANSTCYRHNVANGHFNPIGWQLAHAASSSSTSSPNSSRIPRSSSIAPSSSPIASCARAAGSGNSFVPPSPSSLSQAMSKLSPRSAIHSRVKQRKRAVSGFPPSRE